MPRRAVGLFFFVILMLGSFDDLLRFVGGNILIADVPNAVQHRSLHQPLLLRTLHP